MISRARVELIKHLCNLSYYSSTFPRIILVSSRCLGDYRRLLFYNQSSFGLSWTPLVSDNSLLILYSLLTCGRDFLYIGPADDGLNWDLGTAHF